MQFQVYGDQEMHDAARRLAMDYILQNADYFSQYITEDIETLVRIQVIPAKSCASKVLL